MYRFRKLLDVVLQTSISLSLGNIKYFLNVRNYKVLLAIRKKTAIMRKILNDCTLKFLPLVF
jgi:hypothetical protein